MSARASDRRGHDRLAAILDRSYSSSGTSEKRRRPLGVALAASVLLVAGVIVGYWLIMAGVERYGVVARAVESTGDGTVKVLSPRLMKALAIVLEIVLGVVIVMFLLGLFDATT